MTIFSLDNKTGMWYSVKTYIEKELQPKEHRDMKTTLLIMAAGIGSRFGGGIKQLEPVGLNDEIIMDYSVHDAIAAGFNKLIFVIRKDIEADFRSRIGNRIEALCSRLDVEVHYAFQDMQDIPADFQVPADRKKPWGTGQAVLAARELLTEPFIVINADDYYGKEAYRKLYGWLQQTHAENAIAMAGFVLGNTLSESGGVTRGVCTVREGYVTDVVETKNIVKTTSGAETEGRALDVQSLVSMNMWAFPGQQGQKPWFVKVLEESFADFFRQEVPANPQKAEYLLPTLIGALLRQDKCTVEVLPTGDKWFGVTYKEDKPAVVQSFRALIEQGVYKPNLYEDLM